ncbi:MAG: uroporphyrinogen-III synthase [Acidobacteriota bacterium]|jgi:uroporphyrinogen-III synthase
MRGWVLVTRPAHELQALAGALADHGMEVVPYPVLQEVAAEDEPGWRRVSDSLARIAALFVTSPRAPRHLAEQAQRRGLWPALAPLPTAAVGAATARACRQWGLHVEREGNTGGEALAREMVGNLHSGQAVLHPTGRHHREEAYNVFAAAGVDVCTVEVYDMLESEADALPPLPEAAPAAVLLTSPRAAEAYLRAAPPQLRRAPHFALGPTTATAAASLGVSPRTLSRPDPLLLVEELCKS